MMTRLCTNINKNASCILVYTIFDLLRKIAINEIILILKFKNATFNNYHQIIHVLIIYLNTKSLDHPG